MLNHKDTTIKLQWKYLQQNNPIYFWAYLQIHTQELEGEVSALTALAVKKVSQSSVWHEYIFSLFLAHEVAVSPLPPFLPPFTLSFPYLIFDSPLVSFHFSSFTLQIQMSWRNVIMKACLEKTHQGGPLVRPLWKVNRFHCHVEIWSLAIL